MFDEERIETDDPHAHGYLKWESRYAKMPRGAWALGDAPTREVMMAVEYYRRIHGKARRPKAVDLGAGDGRNTLYVSMQKFDVIAVDAAESGIKRLRRNLNMAGLRAETVVADLRDYPLMQEIDLLLACYIVHLLPTPYEFIQQWQAHTKPGGICVVSTRSRFPHDPPQYWFPEPLELKGIFLDAGWKLLHAHEEDNLRDDDILFHRTAVVAQKPAP